MRNLVVGAGISGLVLAERLANQLNEEVLIIDRRDHIGGNLYDYESEGILVHKYGAHIFHTNSYRVWEYLNSFSRFYPYMHEVKAFINGHFAPIPFNLNSLAILFPKSLYKKLERQLLKLYPYESKVSILELSKVRELKFLSDFIYQNVFYHYTLKQWQCQPEELDASVMSRVPVCIGKDNRYFKDIFQGIPIDGYTKMCEKMIDNPLIKLLLNQDFKNMSDIGYDRVFYSGGIDEYFDYCYGELPYRSLEFDIRKFAKEYFQTNSVVNYPNNYDFTRIIEYKYFLDQKNPQTIVGFEYPRNYQRGMERFYPVPNDKNRKLYERYLKKAKQLKDVYFVGRLGEYQYYDIDQAVLKALDLFEVILKRK
ncbi:UDP-galactopyranose mutase [Helicobacter cappadocius]|uniref:UDP-galactopyranose mutase n=1 Tax=Helicobacter cappadocius TaxID=3063998 RepID=A0AA90PYX4_9HELI|nr:MULTISPECIES: UDP-galactopyranose mutase [unclassified Helicobacter]MDO7253209.1 UDP-galactopyranose mutase [Helicobacter sp. faydin-H75]MDP2539133.1 UDP-galactopyranose mutase [Helicobacter sp. faydin-H76]